MVLQSRIETYYLDETDYILYCITNNDSTNPFKEGSKDRPGLKITLAYDLSYEYWCTQVWPHVEINAVGSNDYSLSDEAIREIVFCILSGKHKSIGGWKITSVEFWSNGALELDLCNKYIDEQHNFLERREAELYGQTGKRPTLTENTPDCYYSLKFNVGEEQSLRFEIAPSKLDKCQYSLVLNEQSFRAKECSPKHFRSIEFGEPIEDQAGTIYKARIIEGILH